MTIEIIIYIVLACICGAGRRIYASINNGIFYLAQRIQSNKKTVIHEKLKKYYNNIHFVASPANYLQQFMVFFLMMGINRLIFPEITLLVYLLLILSAFLIAVGQSTLASYHWQIWINRGSGLPDIDPNENHKSEFAVGNKSFWFSTGKLFNGKRSIFLILLGIIQIVLGILIIILL